MPVPQLQGGPASLQDSYVLSPKQKGSNAVQQHPQKDKCLLYCVNSLRAEIFVLLIAITNKCLLK